MNSFELIPTEENLLQTLQDDLLQRNNKLELFYNLLLNQNFSSSIAIDGRWGSGKTFFVKQAALIINAKNLSSTMDSNMRTNILSSFSSIASMASSPTTCQLAVYYDAWENDTDDDPILSLIYNIMEELGTSYDFSGKKDIFKLAGSILESFINKDVNKIIDNLKSDNPIAKFQEQKDLNNKIKNFFRQLKAERGNRLVIFIDELDRCRPSYAVKLLERIKHYLCDEDITFVFSVNLAELQHTIGYYYGNNFDSCRYLDRFFDMRISLPPADKTRFYEKIGLNTSQFLEKISLRIINVYNMELRETCRLYRQVKTAVYIPTHTSEQWDFAFSDGKAREVLLLYILPVLIGLKIVNISLYADFIEGKNATPLMDIYKDSNEGKCLISILLNKDETNENIHGLKKISSEQKLQELYEAIFVNEYKDGNYNTIIGKCEFTEKSKKFILDVESMLSRYANYHL